MRWFFLKLDSLVGLECGEYKATLNLMIIMMNYYEDLHEFKDKNFF